MQIIYIYRYAFVERYIFLFICTSMMSTLPVRYLLTVKNLSQRDSPEQPLVGEAPERVSQEMVPPCGSIIQGTMIGLSIIRDYQLSN
jgi:hypothetical protein